MRVQERRNRPFLSKNISKYFRGLEIKESDFNREEKICLDIYTSHKANLPIQGIHFPPLIPERKRTLLQMLRIEAHFQKKMNKIAAANEEAEAEGKPHQNQKKSSSSLNTMRFTQF